MACRHVLGDEDPGARHFAADGRALQDAQHQQQHRRGQSDRLVSRHQAHQQRGHGHQQDRQREHLLAAEQVAEVRHDDAAQRPRQVARREDAEGLQLAQPVGHRRREEQLADHRREEHEDDEVVEFERAAEGGKRKRLVILAGEGARAGARRADNRGGTAGGRHGMDSHGRERMRSAQHGIT